MIVNLRDSKNNRCRDQDLSRPKIMRDVETETFRDQAIWWMSRPRRDETEQKLSRLYRESRKSLILLVFAHSVLETMIGSIETDSAPLYILSDLI